MHAIKTRNYIYRGRGALTRFEGFNDVYGTGEGR